MKITSVGEAKELEQYVSPAGCERFGKYPQQVRDLYARAYGLTLEEMSGYHVHHLCGQGYECLNPDHLVLMTPGDHNRLEHTGRTHTAESKEKMSQAKMGKTPSAETRAKISNAKKGKSGKPHTAEHKAKISALMTGNQYAKGHVQTDLDKLKKSLSQRIRWARKRGDNDVADQLQIERDALDKPKED